MNTLHFVRKHWDARLYSRRRGSDTTGAGVSSFPEAEIEAAAAFLADCPVSGYAGFTAEEVRIVAAYLSYVSGASYNTFWRGLVAGYPEAYTYAVHEAAEIEAFVALGVNPFDADQHIAYLREAHLEAIRVELKFLRDWAAERVGEVPELALELTNPIRGGSRSHAEFARRLQQRERWKEPTEAQKETTRQFWRQVTGAKA